MRLDKYLADKFGSRTKAAEAIASGAVTVNGKEVNPSFEVSESDKIEFFERESFVSNGGYKLAKALKDFGVSVKDKIFADVGASNGGFTDCLLKNGAKKVYCIDVGESQLDEELMGERVVIMDNFNARNLTKEVFAEIPDGAVIDVSFISLTYILKQVADAIADDGFIIALIKPQFECEKKQIGKRGIVKDPSLHKAAIKKICDFAQNIALSVENLTNAPIIEGKNKEYLVLLTKNKISIDTHKLIKRVIL